MEVLKPVIGSTASAGIKSARTYDGPPPLAPPPEVVNQRVADEVTKTLAAILNVPCPAAGTYDGYCSALQGLLHVKFPLKSVPAAERPPSGPASAPFAPPPPKPPCAPKAPAPAPRAHEYSFF